MVLKTSFFLGRRIQVALIAVMLVSGLGSLAQAELNPSEKKSRDRYITSLVTQLLDRQHLLRRNLDNEISNRAFESFLKQLDPMKVYFYQSDIDEFSLSVDLVDEDGANMFNGRSLTQRIRVRRAPGMRAGDDIGVVRAFTFNNLVFPKEGGYAFRLMVDGEEVARLRFRIRHRPHPSGGGEDADSNDG